MEDAAGPPSPDERESVLTATQESQEALRRIASWLSSPETQAALARTQRRLTEVAAEASAIAVRVAQTVQPALKTIAKFAAFAAIELRAAIPSNWRELRTWPSVHQIVNLLVEEGLALAWVPPSAVLQELLQAPSAADRRLLIDSHTSAILDACEEILGEVTDPALAEYASFALEALDAFRNGTSAAAQALNANILDSVLRTELEPPRLATIVGAKRPPADLDAFSLREAFVLLGVYGAFASWWPSMGTPPPESFSRHMSAHRVSRVQYTRTNAVLSSMHVVALLKHFQGERTRATGSPIL